MCEYCGCRQIPPLAELMDEHFALLDIGAVLDLALRHGDHARVTEALTLLARRLETHVTREEEGVFTAMRAIGEFVGEIDDLEQEHIDFAADLTELIALDPRDPEMAGRAAAMVAHLSEHIDRENLGIFPVSVVSLGKTGWDTVAAAHTTHPTFLDRAGLEPSLDPGPLVTGE